MTERGGLRDFIRSRLVPKPVTEPEPELPEPDTPEPSQPVAEAPTREYLFGTQYRLRISSDEVLLRRYGPAGWRGRITDGREADRRREQARQAGFCDDVLFPPLP